VICSQGRTVGEAATPVLTGAEVVPDVAGGATGGVDESEDGTDRFLVATLCGGLVEADGFAGGLTTAVGPFSASTFVVGGVGCSGTGSEVSPADGAAGAVAVGTAIGGAAECFVRK
jgi:hypothetical protein